MYVCNNCHTSYDLVTYSLRNTFSRKIQDSVMFAKVAERFDTFTSIIINCNYCSLKEDAC